MLCLQLEMTISRTSERLPNGRRIFGIGACDERYLELDARRVKNDA